MKYIYFISYAYTGTKGNGWGSAEAFFSEPINKIEDLRETEKRLNQQYSGTTTILHFQLLRTEDE